MTSSERIFRLKHFTSYLSDIIGKHKITQVKRISKPYKWGEQWVTNLVHKRCCYYKTHPITKIPFFLDALCYRIAHDILIEMPFALQSSTQDARTP